jgi:hypothetical protein
VVAGVTEKRQIEHLVRQRGVHSQWHSHSIDIHLHKVDAGILVASAAPVADVARSRRVEDDSIALVSLSRAELFASVEDNDLFAQKTLPLPRAQPSARSTIEGHRGSARW